MNGGFSAPCTCACVELQFPCSDPQILEPAGCVTTMMRIKSSDDADVDAGGDGEGVVDYTIRMTR